MKTTTPRACHAYFEYMTDYFSGVDECVNLYEEKKSILLFIITCISN